MSCQFCERSILKDHTDLYCHESPVPIKVSKEHYCSKYQMIMWGSGQSLIQHMHNQLARLELTDVPKLERKIVRLEREMRKLRAAQTTSVDKTS